MMAMMLSHPSDGPYPAALLQGAGKSSRCWCDRQGCGRRGYRPDAPASGECRSWRPGEKGSCHPRLSCPRTLRCGQEPVSREPLLLQLQQLQLLLHLTDPCSCPPLVERGFRRRAWRTWCRRFVLLSPIHALFSAQFPSIRFACQLNSSSSQNQKPTADSACSVGVSRLPTKLLISESRAARDYARDSEIRARRRRREFVGGVWRCW